MKNYIMMPTKYSDILIKISVYSLCAVFLIKSSSAKPEIIIVGAGVAGLAAASKLIENGLESVTLLEAENRYGGRIYTAKFGKIMFDMGAKWCNRDVNDIVYKFAHPLGYLAPSEFNESLSQYYDSTGNEVSVKTITNLFDSICEEQKKMCNYNGSIGDFFLNRLEEKLKKEYVDMAEKDMYTEFYNKVVQSLVGADSWFDATAECGRVVCKQNHLLWKEKGYTAVLDLLIDSNLNNGKNITLRKKILNYIKVTNINIKDGYVSVKCKDLRTLQNRHYKVDHVIVTVSLGVLKAEMDTLFTPKLPERNRKAIEGLEFGKFSQIFLEYKKVWWPESFSGVNFLWNGNKSATVAKVFFGRNYDDYKWLHEVKGVYPVVNKSNFLMVWIGGSVSLRVDYLPKTIIEKRITTLLRHFLGKKYKVPEPLNIYRIKWGLNSNFLGVYSYHSVKTKEMNITGEDLSQPLLNKYGKPVVHFAGEATSLHHYSTVHGAISTGRRAADLISQLYK